jgi:hypothetical protein
MIVSWGVDRTIGIIIGTEGGAMLDPPEAGIDDPPVKDD